MHHPYGDTCPMRLQLKNRPPCAHSTTISLDRQIWPGSPMIVAVEPVVIESTTTESINQLAGDDTTYTGAGQKVIVQQLRRFVARLTV